MQNAFKCKYYFGNKSSEPAGLQTEKVWNVASVLGTGERSILAFLDTTNVLRSTVNSLTRSTNTHVAHYTDSSLCINSKSHLPKQPALLLMKKQMSMCLFRSDLALRQTQPHAFQRALGLPTLCL